MKTDPPEPPPEWSESRPRHRPRSCRVRDSAACGDQDGAAAVCRRIRVAAAAAAAGIGGRVIDPYVMPPAPSRPGALAAVSRACDELLVVWGPPRAVAETWLATFWPW